MRGRERNHGGGGSPRGPRSPLTPLPQTGAPLEAPPDVERLWRVAEVHLAADNTAAALHALREARARVSARSGDPRLRAELLVRATDCHYRRGELDSALAQIQRALGFLDQEREPILTGRALSREAYVYTALGRYDAALASSEQAFELLKPSNEHLEIGFLEIARGSIHLRRGDMTRSRECYESALFSFRRIDHREGIALALNNLGVLLKNGPQWADAREFLTRALAVSEEAGNYGRVAMHCVNLGILCTKLCDWELAEAHLARAIGINREIANSFSLVKSLLAMALLRRRRGQLTAGSELVAEAREICDEQGFGREGVLCDEIAGDLHADRGATEQARARYSRGLRRALEVAPEGDLVPELKRRLAGLALRGGDGATARRLAVQAYREADRLAATTEAGAALRVLGEALGQTRSAASAGRLLQCSVEILARTPERYEHALSQLALARALEVHPEEEGAGIAATTQVAQAIDLAHKAWTFFAAADLRVEMVEALVVLAQLRIAHGRLDEGLRDLNRAHQAAVELDDRSLRARIDALREQLEARSAEAARLTSPEASIIGEWAKIFSGDAPGEACLENMLRFVALRLDSASAFVAVPAEGAERDYRLVASVRCDPLEARRILELIAPDVETKGICLAAELEEDPAFAAHASGALHGVRALAALPLDLPAGNGVLYLDRRRPSALPFGGADLRLLSLLGGLLTLGLMQVRREQEIARGKTARRAGGGDGPFSAYITSHQPIRQVFEHLERVGDSTASILIQGETGTGKGLLAQCIHRASIRGERPFVTVNCAALPESLLESELFGHEQGSFTGAHKRKRGLFEEASGGTLFLDEISRTSLAVQAKLLHVVDSHEVRPVGATRGKPVDVRLICASNVDLRQAIRRGTFLEDLFYRLNDFSVDLPPLRERREDIPLLIEHFYRIACREMERHPRGLTREVRARLLDHPWRGNIRELIQVVRRLVALSEDGERITPDLLPSGFAAEATPEEPAAAEAAPLRERIARLEARAIRGALDANGWNRSAVARRLQISYPSLLAKIKRYHLRPNGR